VPSHRLTDSWDSPDAVGPQPPGHLDPVEIDRLQPELLAERAHQLRLLEAAARCGALFSGSEGANWGIA